MELPLNDEQYPPLWGRVAVMGVTGKTDRRIERDAIDLNAERHLPIHKPQQDGHLAPDTLMGVVKDIWYGDESGLQVILFSGNWLDHTYSQMDRVEPSILVTNLRQEAAQDEMTGREIQVIKYGIVRAVYINPNPGPDTSMWPGLFIRNEKVPTGLRGGFFNG